MERRRRLAIALFVCYAVLMVLLLFGRALPSRELPYRELLGRQLNLKPFHTIRLFWRLLRHSGFVRQAVVNLAGNVVMFVPLGLLLPAAFQRKPRLWKTLLVSGLLISAVEMAQLLTLLGSCDVDDLLLNLLGAAIGYGIYAWVKSRREKNEIRAAR